MNDPGPHPNCDDRNESSPDFTAIVEDLLNTISRDGASWRVPEDAVDKTYDQLVDRIVAGSSPASLQRWARGVILNHFKSGPGRSELSSAKMRELPVDKAAGDSLDRPGFLAALRRRLDQLGSEPERFQER